MKILKFWAPWCAPCRVLKTLINGFDKCPIEDINADEGQEAVEKYKIKGLPTLILVDDEGEELWRKTGLSNTLELENVFHKYK